MLASTDQFNSSTILRNAEGTMRWLSLHHTRMAQISCFEFLPSREVRQISNSDQAFHFPELWRSECPSDASHSEQTAWFLTHTFTFHQYQAPKLPCSCQVHVAVQLPNDVLNKGGLFFVFGVYLNAKEARHASPKSCVISSSTIFLTSHQSTLAPKSL